MTTTEQTVKHTEGTWSFRLYAQSDEDLEQVRSLGMTPTRMLTNEGQAAIMSAPDSDGERKRIALVDAQARFKRGEGYKLEDAERDANARLIAAAPDMLAALKGVSTLADQIWVQVSDDEAKEMRTAWAEVAAAIAKATESAVP